MEYKVILFNRLNGCTKPRGAVADHPYNEDAPLADVSRFIAVRVDASTIPEGLENNPTVALKLEELMKKYPSTTDKYKDEEGIENTRTIHGYFHEHGSSSEPYKIITTEDCTWQ